jgi:hypothetical protein
LVETILNKNFKNAFLKDEESIIKCLAIQKHYFSVDVYLDSEYQFSIPGYTSNSYSSSCKPLPANQFFYLDPSQYYPSKYQDKSLKFIFNNKSSKVPLSPHLSIKIQELYKLKSDFNDKKLTNFQ